jgi:hypothetical protein
VKVVLANFTGGRSNWGCRATSLGLTDFLRSECLPPDAVLETVPLPRGHALDRLQEAVHGGRIREIYAKDRPTTEDLDLIEQLVKERFGIYFDMARNADVVLFQGEGSIGPTDYLRNVRLFGLPFLASRKWKKPVLSLNQTLFAASESDRRVLGAILRGFDLVAVREAASYVYGLEMGLSANLLCCPDMAFREDRVSADHLLDGLDNAYFCVSGSALLKKLDEKLIIHAVDRISDATGLAPVLVHSRKNDRELMEAKITSSRSISAKEVPDHRHLVSILAGAKFEFGGRYHTAVSALSQTTPVILLPGNTFKSEGIADLIGVDFPVFSPSDTSDIVAAAKDITGRALDYRNRISAGLGRIARMHEAFAGLLNDFLREGRLDVGRYESLHPVVRWQHRGRFDRLYAGYNTMRKPFGLFQRSTLEKLRRMPGFRDQIARTFTDLP